MRAAVGLIFLLAASVGIADNEFPRLVTSELDAAKETYLRGKFDEALALLDRSDRSFSATAESLDLRGCIYLEQGKFEDAAKAFQSAHTLNYGAFGPRIHLGDALLREKRFEEARTEYKKLLDIIKSPMWPEYLRFGILLSYLGEHDETGAQHALTAIVFPTGSPAYYYAQAAWSFAHGKKSDAMKWINTARKIFDPTKTSWFDRGLYQFGWLKKKPAASTDPFA